MRLPAALTLISAFVLPLAGQAAVITPTSISVTQPAGGTAPSGGVYTDDVYLDMLSFATGTQFSGADDFAAAAMLEVLTGREFINAEWGDTDNGDDGDDNPFVKAGLASPGDVVVDTGTAGPGEIPQESTDPSIQDPALINAFNSRSLSEMSDGENSNGSGFSFKVGFAKSLEDDAPGNADDGVPELIFFERGGNDQFTIEVITGGTFDNPVYSDPVAVDSLQFWDSGISVDTQEITGSQAITAGALDLDTFGLATGDKAFGFRLTVEGTNGPDLNGFFLAAEDPARFGTPLPVPLPPGAALLALAAAALAGLRGRMAG
jgi:hypothetical protein